MKQSALESVRIFRKSGISLDCYKGKEFMSRVVVKLIKFILDNRQYHRILVDKEPLRENQYSLLLTDLY